MSVTGKLVLLSVLACAVWAAPAAAAPGDLLFESCFADTNASGCSVPSQKALREAGAVAVSPDGESVYVGAFGAGAVSHFQRAADGSLTFRGCVADSNATGPNCTVPPAQVLARVTDVEVSPDGGSVYVVSQGDNAISEFERAADGSLTFQSCWAETGAEGCPVPVGGPVMSGATGVTVSPDGRSVYVAAPLDGGITHFNRDPTGELSYRSCLSATAAPGCTVTGAVNGVAQLTVSPDGRSLYSAGLANPGVLSHFSRAASGVLTLDACFSSNATLGCTVPNPAPLDGLLDVIVSPDGASVYVASTTNDAISQFSRAGDGLLTFGSCVADAPIAGCTVPARPVLKRPAGLAISPDGGWVYATSSVKNAVTTFARGPSGGLNFQGCLADAAGVCASSARTSLGGAFGTVVSPDGISAYIASQGPGSITHFRREGPAVVTPPGTTPPGTTPDTTAPVTTKGTGPRRKVRTRKRRARVTFVFSASEQGSTFRCQLDAAAAYSCKSPATTRVKAKRKAKKHTFEVAAIDASGNIDRTPIVFRFKVKRKR